MDAVKFVQDYIRLCAQQENCDTCPIYGIEGVDFCTAIPKEHSLEGCEKLVTLVNAWALAHPTKTRQDTFLEQWPEARIESNGISSICPAVLSKTYRMYNGEKCPNTITPKICTDCRRKFWMQEIE